MTPQRDCISTRSTRPPRWRRRHTWPGWLALLVLACATAVAPAALASKRRHKRPPLTYSVSFNINKGNYRSYVPTNDVKESETDVFATSTAYKLAIPRKGSAPHLVVRGGDFGPGVSTHPTWTFDANRNSAGTYCKGTLVDNDGPPLLYSGHQPGTTLNLYIESVRHDFAVADAHDVSTKGCSGLDGEPAFLLADSENYMPHMLTVHLRVSMRKLRALKVSQASTFKVDQNDVDGSLPPDDCSADTGDPGCTQHLSWSGKVRFERIK